MHSYFEFRTCMLGSRNRMTPLTTKDLAYYTEGRSSIGRTQTRVSAKMLIEVVPSLHPSSRTSLLCLSSIFPLFGLKMRMLTVISSVPSLRWRPTVGQFPQRWPFIHHFSFSVSSSAPLRSPSHSPLFPVSYLCSFFLYLFLIIHIHY